MVKFINFKKEKKFTFKEIMNKMDSTLNYKMYIDEIEKLKKEHDTFEVFGIYVQKLNKKYGQDGSYVYDFFVKDLEKFNYPEEVNEKIKSEFKKMFLAEYYQPIETRNLTPKELEARNERIKKVEDTKQHLSKLAQTIFTDTHSDFDDKSLKEIGKEFATLPINIQKNLVDLNEYEYFTNPSKELIIYALETNHLSLDSLDDNQRTEEIDMLAAKNDNIFQIRKIKLSKKARLEYIKYNPEKIITEINAENYDMTYRLTIYDLSKEELKAYKIAMEEYNKKEEEKQIELVKKDPRAIYKIENPSTLVKNYAISVFRRQWER